MWQLVVPLLLQLNHTLETIHQEQPYDTLLLFKHSNRSRQEGFELAAVPWPILSLDEQVDFYLSGSFNHEMLALAWQSENYDMNLELWQALDRNLENMRQVRLLFLMESDVKEHGNLLKQIASRAEEMQFLQVAVLLNTGHIYRLQPYAKAKWLPIVPGRELIFISIKNFQGKSIRTLPDQLAPRSLVYSDPETGQLRLTGYVAQLLQEFAHLFNLSLEWQRPVLPGEQMSMIVLRNMTLNGTLGLPISLCGFERPSNRGVYSYPYDIAKWFVMVPCPQEVSTAEVYIMIYSARLIGVLIACYIIFSLLDAGFGCLLLQRKLDWTYLCFNERMISGMLGQSFKLSAHNMFSSKVTHAQIFLIGLVLNALFGAHLNTLLTKRPTEQEISDFQQLRDSQLNIYFDQTERFYLDSFDGRRPVDDIRSKIQFLETKEFMQRRANLSNKQAYSISSVGWLIVAKRQELFPQPAVCTPPDLIFGNLILFSLPMQANSIFERPLNQLIHRVHTTGLLDHWKQQTLRKMVTLGLISLEDPFEHIKFYEFKVADLFWAWLCLGLGLLIALITFLGEIYLHSMSRKKGNIFKGDDINGDLHE